MKKKSDKKQNKRIVLQMYINENLGDDLFIDIIANRYPSIDFVIFGIGNRVIPPLYNSKYKNVQVVSTNKWLHKINILSKIILKKDFLLEKELKKSDGLIILGGSVFIDGFNHIEALKANILADVRLHYQKIGKPTFVIGANFGPVYHEKFIKKYKKYFQNCENVCFRDLKSKQIYSNLNNIDYAPDVIFNKRKTNKKANKKTIGFSIIDLSDGSHQKISQFRQAYENKMVELINEFSNLGYEINMYSFCNKQGDNEAINRIKNNILSKKKVNCHEYTNLETSDFINSFTSNEYIISTRFHGMIIGLINEQKVYPIIYDIKTKNVIDELGIDNYCSLDDICKLKISDILNVEMKKNINKIQVNAHKQFEAFEKYFDLDGVNSHEKNN